MWGSSSSQPSLCQVTECPTVIWQPLLSLGQGEEAQAQSGLATCPKITQCNSEQDRDQAL